MTNHNLAASQGQFYATAIQQIYQTVLHSGNPAGRELKAFFSLNKKCGSKDRKFISEGLFALFRWRGWLFDVIEKEFNKGLALALNLENFTESPAYEALCQQASYKTVNFGNTLTEKKNQLEEIFKNEFKIEDLVPGWFNTVEKNKELSFYESLQKRPPVWLRVQNNGLKQVVLELENNKIQFSIHDKIHSAIAIYDKINIESLKSFKDGLIEVQDLASQVLATVCQVKKGDIWWDFCAGAGGKSLALADALKENGKVFSSDKRSDILEELENRAKRGNFSNIMIIDSKQEISSKRLFDGILIDAPCSCTGTWRRNPHARWLDILEKCQKWAVEQEKILSSITEKVKISGYIVYATCSSLKMENEDVVEKFLKKFPNFQLEEIAHPLTGEKTDGMVRVNSLPDDCDMMFAARFVRKF